MKMKKETEHMKKGKALLAFLLVSVLALALCA